MLLTKPPKSPTWDGTKDHKMGVTHRFYAEVSGYNLGGWQKVEGLGFSVDKKPIEEAGVNTYKPMMFGRVIWNNIKLSRAVTLDDWHTTMAYIIDCMQKSDGTLATSHDLKITVLSAWAEVVQTFVFIGARPISWTGPALDTSSAGKVATETIEFYHQGPGALPVPKGH